MKSYWTVLETHFAAESTAAKHATAQGFEVFLPRYRERTGIHLLTPKPLFPEYLFVLIERGMVWQPLANTRGVKRVFLSRDLPEQVPDAVIADIREREDELGYITLPGETPSPRSIRPDAKLARGTRVTSIRGMFRNQTGIFQARTGRDRVRVLFQLIGRPVETEMSVKDLALAT